MIDINTIRSFNPVQLEEIIKCMKQEILEAATRIMYQDEPDESDMEFMESVITILKLTIEIKNDLENKNI